MAAAADGGEGGRDEGEPARVGGDGRRRRGRDDGEQVDGEQRAAQRARMGSEGDTAAARACLREGASVIENRVILACKPQANTS